jgi:aryl-alcohol dehydrogenase-like predicted oxidoreductase
VERIRFLCEQETGRTMPQAALRFILAQPQMTCVIPTITNQAELREYAGAAEAPELTGDELARVAELYERNFDVEPVGA